MSADNPHYQDERKHAKPRLLDLFCGAGGAAMGYHRAGFDVWGIDHLPQPHYPFTFLQRDALEFLQAYIDDDDHGPVDAIHASPPCQAYSQGKNIWHTRLPRERHPDLVGPTRQLLEAAGLPYVMENVVGAPLTNYVVLCGDMFGLGVKRHRLFETSFMVWNPPVCRSDHPDFFVSVFGGGAKAKKKGNGFPKTNIVHERAQKAMGIDWMNRDEMSQAIPPAYTEWIGRQLLEVLERV
jgi:DNA (cytosine-5)-methyltransferase 1